jgi:glutaminase
MSAEKKSGMEGGNQSILEETLRRLHAKHVDCQEGEVATYIPELAKADPRHFGVAVADVEGHLHELGDSQIPFTIQSISKPFLFGVALESHGRDEVLKKIGVEPSGEAFNSVELQQGGRPHNAMVNAGAITATSLVPGSDPKKKMARILEILSGAAGRDLKVDEATYRSELETGDRNRAIAYLLHNAKIVGCVEESLDLYFQQCSVLVTARDLAIMGATLANLGTNPVTGKEVLSFDSVRDVLSVMFTCGMYDFAGEWAFRVGVPAKSGVAGGILGVVNRQMGIGVYSPKLDSLGNSVRGIRFCTDLADEMGLHIFNFTNRGSGFVRAAFGVG